MMNSSKVVIYKPERLVLDHPVVLYYLCLFPFLFANIRGICVSLTFHEGVNIVMDVTFLLLFVCVFVLCLSVFLG